MINVKQIILGKFESNCYILIKDHYALMIDPGASPEIIKKEIKRLNVHPLAILLTHTHFDHIGAVDSLVNEYNIPLYVAPDELNWLKDPQKNLSQHFGQSIVIETVAQTFTYGDTYQIGPFSFKVIHTPGHSPGGVSLVFEEDRFVITGDALFAMSVGRTDLPGSNPEIQIPILRDRLLSLPDDFKIYPGHRGPSTIGQEKEYNPFFQ